MTFKKQKEQINNPATPVTEQGKQDRLDKLFAKFNEYDIGKQILNWGKDHNVKIVFDDQVSNSCFNHKENTIFLSWATEDAELVDSLAHELRHAWQHSIVPLDKYNSNPYALTVFMLFMEADAFSFGFNIDYLFKNLSNDEVNNIDPNMFTYNRQKLFNRFFTPPATSDNSRILVYHYCDRYEKIIDMSCDLLYKSQKKSILNRLFNINCEEVQKELDEYYNEFKNNYRHLEEKDLRIFGETAGLFDTFGKTDFFELQALEGEKNKAITDPFYTQGMTKSLKNTLNKWSKKLKLDDPQKIIPITVTKTGVRNKATNSF